MAINDAGWLIEALGVGDFTVSGLELSNMNQLPDPCAACVPGGRKHASADRESALQLYLRLFARGAFPVMCRRDDGIFYVCCGEQQRDTLVPSTVTAGNAGVLLEAR